MREGTVRVTAKTRVSLSDIEVTDSIDYGRSAAFCRHVDDFWMKKEEKEHFARIRAELLDFTKKF